MKASKKIWEQPREMYEDDVESFIEFIGDGSIAVLGQNELLYEENRK